MVCSVRRRDIHALDPLELCVSYLCESQLQAIHDTPYLCTIYLLPE